jgi:hypothetical protein
VIRVFLKTLAVFLGIFLVVWIIIYTFSLPVESVMKSLRDSIQSTDSDYVCDFERDPSICKKGDWIYVSYTEAPFACYSASLSGGVRLNQYIMPLANGGVAPNNVLCVYRGELREYR